jgi:hypothetical protein
VVDLIAIRKDTSHPSNKILKRGDLFDVVLIQIKGGDIYSHSASTNLTREPL